MDQNQKNMDALQSAVHSLNSLRKVGFDKIRPDGIIEISDVLAVFENGSEIISKNISVAFSFSRGGDARLEIPQNLGFKHHYFGHRTRGIKMTFNEEKKILSIDVDGLEEAGNYRIDLNSAELKE